MPPCPLGRAAIQLRLDQRQQHATGFEQRHHRRQHQGLRDEGQVGHDQVKLGHKSTVSNLRRIAIFVTGGLIVVGWTGFALFSSSR